MSKIYKFIPGTPEFQILGNHFDLIEKWFSQETTNHVAKLLGIDISEIGVGDGQRQVFAHATFLTMRNVPTHLVREFKTTPINESSKGLTFRANKTSKLNKRWVELCNELKLRTVYPTDWAFELGWFNGKSCTLVPMNGDYYVESNMGTFDNDSFLEVIDTPTYLRLKADWVEETEKQKEAV